MKLTLSRRHEQNLAEWIPGGEQTVASGAKLEKHDVKSKKDGFFWRFLYEAKCTQSKGYRITRELWNEVVRNAHLQGQGMRPALAIRFYGESKASVDKVTVDADLVVVDIDDWLELLETLEEYKRRAE